jgi:hypothetical protein
MAMTGFLFGGSHSTWYKKSRSLHAWFPGSEFEQCIPTPAAPECAAYNGVAEYIDYRRFGKASDDRQLNAIWFGEGYSAKARAFAVAQKCIKAWAN